MGNTVGQALAAAVGFPGPTLGAGSGSSGGHANPGGTVSPGASSGGVGLGIGAGNPVVNLNDYLNAYNPFLQLLSGKGDSPFSSIPGLLSLIGGGGSLLSGGSNGSNNPLSTIASLGGSSSSPSSPNPLSLLAPSLALAGGQILNPLEPLTPATPPSLPQEQDTNKQQKKKKKPTTADLLTALLSQNQTQVI